MMLTLALSRTVCWIVCSPGSESVKLFTCAMSFPGSLLDRSHIALRLAASSFVATYDHLFRRIVLILVSILFHANMSLDTSEFPISSQNRLSRLCRKKRFCLDLFLLPSYWSVLHSLQQ